MKIRTLLIDDVNLARERIKMMLDTNEFELISECDNGHDAVNVILNSKPDLVFLDVQMPEMNGFEVIEAVGIEQMPPTIFTTAYDKFALRAFDSQAVDYLLKPFDKFRLERAVNKAKREIDQQSLSVFRERLGSLIREINPAPKYLKRISVKTAGGTILLPIDEVSWMSAAGHYIELHTGKKKTHLTREQISQLEKKLDPEKFVRIHRSTIVNINCLKSFHPLFSGDHLIILNDGTELNMSRTYHAKLMGLLSF